MATATAASFNKIERAHQMYREGRYEEALSYYTEALAVAKTKPQKIALHSNRAACYLKLHHFKKAAEECTSVLELDHKHTGALMLRAQTLVTLKEYNSALFDVNQLIELNPNSEVYHNLHARLKTQVALAPIPESDAELEEEEEDEEDEEEHGQYYTMENEEERVEESEVGPAVRNDLNAGSNEDSVNAEKIYPNERDVKGSPEHDRDSKNVPERNPEADPQEPNDKDSKGSQMIPKPNGHSDQKNVPQKTSPPVPPVKSIKDSNGWQAIPKPKGHSALDYARWDRVEDDSSEEEEDDDDEESQPQYRFRVRTVGVRPVK
ncbi:Tetratricopeptide-like helical [Corchorus capsularis]|uniref:Tetratricopeptide-like helical n=1 Tax=Corchorus capsularis TaxID=210143 RepID=A0A1R3J0N2_COCAP|nr:Tetratricopeptide-like helical [Corchorus capsularis]